MSNSLVFKDFYQVPDLSFDIKKLRNDLDLILKKSKYKKYVLRGGIFLGNKSKKHTKNVVAQILLK